MISHTRLRYELEREWVRLQTHELDTDFMKGIIRGLKLANAMALDLWQREKDANQSNNPMGRPTDLLRMIVKVRTLVDQGKRKDALAMLNKTIEVNKPRVIQTGDK